MKRTKTPSSIFHAYSKTENGKIDQTINVLESVASNMNPSMEKETLEAAALILQDEVKNDE